MKRIIINAFLMLSLLVNAPNNFAQKPKPSAEFDANIPKNYVQLINIFIMKTAIAPANAARMHGYVGLTLYEATVAGSLQFQSLAKQLNGFENPPVASKPLLWDVVADEAMHAVTDSLFSYLYANIAGYNYVKNALDTLQTRNKNYFKIRYKNPKLMDESIKFGRLMANHIY